MNSEVLFQDPNRAVQSPRLTGGHCPGLAPAFFFCLDECGILRGSKLMRTDRAEQVAQLIRQHQAVEAEREAEARQMAHVLIQNHLGLDDD